MKTFWLFASLFSLCAGVPAEAHDDPNPAQLNAAGLELYHQGRFVEAEAAYRRSLAAWDRLGPQTALSRAITSGNLGAVLQVEGRYAEAQSLLATCLQQVETITGPQSPDAARANESLASLYVAWGSPDRAEPYGVRAKTIFDAAEGQPEGRIASRRMLASVLLAEGRAPEAEDLLRALLPELPERAAASAYSDLAAAETSRNHLAEAEEFAAKALDLARRNYPAGHPMLAIVLNNLAQVQRFEGSYLDAEKNYRAAIDIWKHAFGPQHPDVAKGLMNLAAFYHDRGRETGAEDLYRQAAAIFEDAYGSNHPLTLIARNELAEVLRVQGRYSESERLSRQTVGLLEKELHAGDPRLVRVLSNYARLLEDTRRAADASAIRKRIQALGQGFRDQTP